MNLVVRLSAVADMRDAYDWYENHALDLAMIFLQQSTMSCSRLRKARDDILSRFSTRDAFSSDTILVAISMRDVDPSGPRS